MIFRDELRPPEGGSLLCVRSAPARSMRLGLTVLEQRLALRADPFGLLGARPPHQLGVVDPAVVADMGSDGEIIHGANRGGLLGHLTRVLPHARISFVSRAADC